MSFLRAGFKKDICQLWGGDGKGVGDPSPPPYLDICFPNPHLFFQRANTF